VSAFWLPELGLVLPVKEFTHLKMLVSDFHEADIFQIYLPATQKQMPFTIIVLEMTGSDSRLEEWIIVTAS